MIHSCRTGKIHLLPLGLERLPGVISGTTLDSQRLVIYERLLGKTLPCTIYGVDTILTILRPKIFSVRTNAMPIMKPKGYIVYLE